MSIEIIGMVGTKEVSESRGSFDGPQIDAGYLACFAQAHEAAGFDRVLIGYGATGPDGFAVAAHVLYATSALKVLIAHRPGFVAPTLVADTQRDLTRIGIDHIAGTAGPPYEWRGVAPRLASYPVSDFACLAAVWRDQPVAVLDVRRRLEWSAGHIEGATHVPLHQLPGRLPDLPPGPIWVHCQAGYRASVAASILHAAGHAVTAIDDDFRRAPLAGLPLTTALAAEASFPKV
jgi:rhodanese-related sulfurtransferase